MSDQRPPYRRRRPPANDTLAGGAQQAPASSMPPAQEAPRRIVAQDHEEPEWMVSSERVGGAAQRRTGKAPQAPAAPAGAPAGSARSTQEGRAILAMKNAAQGMNAQRADVQENTEYTDYTANTENAAVTPAAPPARKAAGARPAPQRTAKPAVKGQDDGEGVSIPVAPRVKAAQRGSAPAKKPPRKLTKKQRARRNAQIRRTAALMIGAVLFVALCAGAAIGGARLIDIKKTLDVGDGVFYRNIFVNGIPLAGMTLDQAADIVTNQVQNQIAGWKITLRATDGSGRTWDITGADMKMKYNVADQLDQLWAIGHTGSSAQRYEQVKKLEDEPAMRYTTLTYDLSRVNQILAQIKTEVDKPPVNAKKVYDDTKWPPYSYTDDTPGQELDITGLNERICAMVDTLQSGTVDLAPTPVQAAVTRKGLEESIVLLAEYETAIGATSDPGRFINIEVGTRKFDKLVIKSGESVSFNKVAGKRTYSNGYADAPEVAYGDYTMGVGGGICQVSSTLYNAVVNAGLAVTKRTQHSLPSNYVPYGLDATVADDRLDFVFKNSTNADIFISSQYYKKKNYWYCKFIIHGRPDPNGYSYKLESTVREELPIPEPTYIPDKDAQYVVYDDETYQASEGDEGYIVDVYLVTLDQAGKEISREFKYTDTYKTKTPKVYIGVTPRETPVPMDLFLID